MIRLQLYKRVRIIVQQPHTQTTTTTKILSSNRAMWLTTNHFVFLSFFPRFESMCFNGFSLFRQEMPSVFCLFTEELSCVVGWRCFFSFFCCFLMTFFFHSFTLVTRICVWSFHEFWNIHGCVFIFIMLFIAPEKKIIP